MSRMECIREADVLEAVTCGRWPGTCDEELLAHVSSCSICSDAAQIALLLRDDYALNSERVRVPSPGLVWWRAQLRARQEAARAAARPINVVQAFACACGIGLAVGLVARMTDWVWLSAVLGAVIILAPAALYLVFSDK